MTKDVLVVEISGKRPGDKRARPTEKFYTEYNHMIISNNSDGYITEWPIVNVPDDYRKWYITKIKNSDGAWYAPMNRSYAIKYARENGYKYLAQLDDNINCLEIAVLQKKGKGKIQKRIRHRSTTQMLDDFIEMQLTVLQNTNAAMVGHQLKGIGEPDMAFIRERYVYSIFMLDLDRCPDVFQGDFEDDIEYRLKCAQMGYPVVQISPLRYGKVQNVQKSKNDMTGCRAEYAKAGLKRGENMSKLYGDIYSCRMRNRPNCVANVKSEENIYFQHKLKPIKLGIIVYDMEPIKQCMESIFRKYAEDKPDKVIIKEKKVKKSASRKAEKRN